MEEYIKNEESLEVLQARVNRLRAQAQQAASKGNMHMCDAYNKEAAMLQASIDSRKNTVNPGKKQR